MAKVKLPKSLLEMDEQDRKEIIDVLLQASKLPKSRQLPYRKGASEHKMWERNVDSLMAEAEDEFYEELAQDGLQRIIDLMHGLGLPIDTTYFEKSLEPEFLQWEDELIKSKGSGRNRMRDMITRMSEATKKRVKQFTEWVADGKALTKTDLSNIDKVLTKKLPDYAKKAEAFVTRAGFIGKVQGTTERENLEVVGAVIDRIPTSIQASRKEGVVLTARQAEAEKKRTGKTVKVQPLTPREVEGVKHASNHAGDKLTEISAKHRADIRQMVIQAKRERWSSQQLASKLLDKFGDQNRDWRRVAITELSFAVNDAYLAGVEEGEQVIGMGAENACQHCKRYVIGKVFKVTHKPPATDTYEGDMKMVWAGKSNYGRRVAEYRPAIPMHPNCRCRWHRISRFYKLGKNGKLELKSTAELIQEERAKRGMKPDPNIQSKEGRALTQEELAKKSEEVLRKLNG